MDVKREPSGLKTADRNATRPVQQEKTALFDKLSLPDAPSMATPVPGPRSRELLARQESRESNARTYPRGMPIAVRRARGATVEDVDGNVFLDFWAGAGTLNFGHNHPEITRAAQEQLGEMVHTLDLPSEVKDTFTSKVLSLLPPSLQGKMKIQFAGPTGADAVEAALKLAKIATGRRSILSFQGGYHGMTTGALSVTGQRSAKEQLPSLMPDVHFLPYSFCYRCPLGLERESCAVNCATFAESVLRDPLSGVVRPAAVILEFVQGEAGSIPGDVEFLQKIAKSARDAGSLLIADEIQAGMGRTGKVFAFEHAGVEPDIIVMSKALGGAGLPIAVILYKEELDVWEPGAHVGTFRGFLPAMASGIAAIDFMREADVPANAARMGELFREGLASIASRHARIGEVRGRGLMIGVEIVQDSDTKSPAPDLAARLRTECVKRGLMLELGGRDGSVVRFTPPLIITENQVARAVEVFDDAASEALENR